MHAHLALGPSGGEVGVVAAPDGVRVAAGALHRGERPRARVVDLLPHRDRLHHGRGRVARLGGGDRAVPGWAGWEIIWTWRQMRQYLNNTWWPICSRNRLFWHHHYQSQDKLLCSKMQLRSQHKLVREQIGHHVN